MGRIINLQTWPDSPTTRQPLPAAAGNDDFQALLRHFEQMSEDDRDWLLRIAAILRHHTP